jgi:hypothetical protein
MANALTLTAGSVSGGATTTAIVGDNPTPYGSAILTPGDSMTTGDLALGEAGEAGGLLDFSVEGWFRWALASPTPSTSLLIGPLSTSGANRQWGFYIAAGGGVQFGSVNAAGTAIFSGQTAVPTLDTWYHVVGVITGGNIRVYLNGVDAGASAFVGAVRPSAFTAGSAAMEVLYAGGTNQYIDELAIYRTGLSAARVLEHYNAGVNRGYPFQLPGTRIGAVLDTVGSPAPRSIQAGTRNVIPRYMSGQSPLEECRRAVEAEDVDAALFVTADGTLKFLADSHRSSSPYNTIQATFGDGAGELAYVDIDTDYSASELINEWNVTRSVFGTTAPTTQTASDATSISRYFKHSQSLSDVPTTNDANCATIAAGLLAKYKDALYRITSISFNTIDPTVTEAVLQRELMDKVRILRTPPGGGSRIQQDVFIQRIEISGSNDGGPWTIRWTVSPL